MSQQINLINPALRKKRDLLTAVPLTGALGVLLVLLMTASTMARHQADAIQAEADKRAADLKSTQARLLEMGKSVGDAKPNQELIDELANSRAMLNLREEVIGAMEGGTFRNSRGFADVMRGFARQVPEGLWLTGFVLDATSNEMEIRGRMLRSTALPDYIRRLNAEAAFQGRGFSSLIIQRPGEGVDSGIAPAPAAKQAALALPSGMQPVEFVMRTKPPEVGAPKAGGMSTESPAIGKALETRP